jgi:hypothetical protein
MKKLLFALAILAFAATANAQDAKRDKPFLFSLGLEGALPLGDFGKAYDWGFGGSLQGEYKVAPELGLTLNAGYLTFSKESDATPSFGLVPVLAGAKYYIGGGAYVHGQLGAGFGTDEGQGTNFMYTPGIGYLFAPGFDAQLKYVGISNSGEDTGSANFLGLRLAYNF